MRRAEELVSCSFSSSPPPRRVLRFARAVLLCPLLLKGYILSFLLVGPSFLITSSQFPVEAPTPAQKSHKAVCFRRQWAEELR
jgi:hypothetical protein